MTDPVTSFSTQPISEAIEKLRQLTQVSIQASWHVCASNLSPDAIFEADFWNWAIADLNDKAQIVWPAGRQVLWLVQRVAIAQQLRGYPLEGLILRLGLTWWAQDAQIFVNGSLVQTGDLFDYFTRVLLSPAVTPGEEITIALRLVSPSHDRGALVRSICIYESRDNNRFEPGFIADELAVLQGYLERFAPEKLNLLTEAIAEIDWEGLPDGERFDRSLSNLRQTLLLSQITSLKSKINLLGHAHLDMAWLWPVSETWQAAQRTFESVLKLQQDFPDLIFCHSTPALYAWIEEHRPDLFAAIQQQVANGRWEIVGGMWVEPDLNLISGESIVRQILYAQRYVQAKFGFLSTVAWVPDTFGFCATLPQFLQQGGIEYFVTQKLRWNDTTQFPYEIFEWRSPDGSQILSFMSALIGEGIDPIKMANYAGDWEAKTGLKDALWLPGVGDHGGGPTRDMLELAERWKQSPFFPHLEFTTAHAYLQKITQDSGLSTQHSGLSTQHSGLSTQNLPLWNDELYLEFHRGCYTTHAGQKRWNRRCEGLLYQAELFASLATLSAGAAYPKAELETAWKKVLFNQFHDILPGTSIPEVFVDANQAWQEVEQAGVTILEQSLSAIAAQISLPPPPQPDALPVFVFNSLNWERSAVVSLPLPKGDSKPVGDGAEREDFSFHWEIYDLSGQRLPSQLSDDGMLLFLAKNIPSVGYRVFWLCPPTAETLDAARSVEKRDKKTHYTNSIATKFTSSENKKSFDSNNWTLENQLLRAKIDSKTGNLSSIFDKIHNREILQNPGGNQLQAFQDSGQYWDAWNIDPNYEQHLLPPLQLKSIQWIEQGSVQQRLRVVRQIGESEFCQDYVLEAESPILKIVTKVNWQERQVLVKAAFPLNLEADYVTYEIPCGAIKRTTRPQEPSEKAKWEVPALRWADLSSDDYGVSLLNDCKYGYDSQPNRLRLTLLRSPNWPDPEADRGNHEFTYAVYPHRGNSQSAGTVRRGYELNLPLQVKLAEVRDTPLESLCDRTHSSLPSQGQLLNLSSDNLILMAFKQSEDHVHQWILRCYECHGEVAELKLQNAVGLKITSSVDLLEQPTSNPESLSEQETFSIAPWKIATFRFKTTQ